MLFFCALFLNWSELISPLTETRTPAKNPKGDEAVPLTLSSFSLAAFNYEFILLKI